MKIQNSYSQQTFQAKFLYSDSLKQIADYAVAHGKFEKLNTARKNIDNAFLTTRLKVDIYKENGKCGVSFARYIPKKNVLVAQNYDEDYFLAKVITYETEKISNPLKFALYKILKLGNNAPNNNMYKEVVIKKTNTK